MTGSATPPGTGGYYLEYRPSRMERLWRRLGFQHPHVPIQHLHWPCGDKVHTDIIVGLDWRDRLRVLVSGRIGVTNVTDTSGRPGEMLTRSAFGVLPPQRRPRAPREQARPSV